MDKCRTVTKILCLNHIKSKIRKRFLILFPKVTNERTKLALLSICQQLFDATRLIINIYVQLLLSERSTSKSFWGLWNFSSMKQLKPSLKLLVSDFGLNSDETAVNELRVWAKFSTRVENTRLRYNKMRFGNWLEYFAILSVRALYVQLLPSKSPGPMKQVDTGVLLEDKFTVVDSIASLIAHWVTGKHGSTLGICKPCDWR